MKLSLPDSSIRSCLLALAAVLILPMPASYTPYWFSGNWGGHGNTGYDRPNDGG